MLNKVISRLRNVTRRGSGIQFDPSRDPLIPSPIINYNQVAATSTDEYYKTHKHDSCIKHLPFLIRKAHLTPTSAMLDFGCGLGRHAYAASKYLSNEGRYFGHDINQGSIDFLKSAYSGFPNFSFNCAPLATAEDYVAITFGRENDSSGRAADINLSSFVTEQIDVQWSSSVFTHMWPEAIVHVLRQFNDVMKSDGLCVNTWLMVDDFAAYVLKCGLADRELPYRVREALTYSKENPLTCTAYEDKIMREIYNDAGQEIVEILPGSWSGRDNGVIYQDIVISRPK